VGGVERNCNVQEECGSVVDQLDQTIGLRNNQGCLTNLTNWRPRMAANPIPSISKASSRPVQVNLYEAKTQLSSLVDRAAKGEEIIIAKAGKAMAKLTPLAEEEVDLKPLCKFGQNLLGIEFLSDDWEKDIPAEWFEDPEEDKLLSGDMSS
jgi:prevent-host-death family protein